MDRLGARSEILCYFHDDNGKLVDTDLSRRCVTLAYNELAGRNIVAAAGGPDKVDAIRSVLKSGLLSGLITDEATALKLAGEETQQISVMKLRSNRKRLDRERADPAAPPTMRANRTAKTIVPEASSGVGHRNSWAIAAGWEAGRRAMTEHTSPAKALSIAGIGKSYGATQVLSDITFDVHMGRVHALVGENGAGKSTLVKIITGVVAADTGEVLIGSKIARFRTPSDARAAGVSAVYQDPKLFPHLDVAENIFMGNYPLTAFGAVDRKAMYERAGGALRQLGLDLDPRSLVAGLSMAELQFVEMARALVDGCSTAHPRRTDLRADACRERQAVRDRRQAPRAKQIDPVHHPST